MMPRIFVRDVLEFVAGARALAHVVALQTRRSNDPMRWAKRFLKEQRQRAQARPDSRELWSG
jgi:hypothetical protein